MKKVALIAIVIGVFFILTGIILGDWSYLAPGIFFMLWAALLRYFWGRSKTGPESSRPEEFDSIFVSDTQSSESLEPGGGEFGGGGASGDWDDYDSDSSDD